VLTELTASLVEWLQVRLTDKGFREKILSSNTESGLVPSIYGNRLTFYYVGRITQMVKNSVLLLRNFRKTEKSPVILCPTRESNLTGSRTCDHKTNEAVISYYNNA
ncbi:hypothetical protein SFRURICE_009601, partial [Spodoptera frugiperda]